MNTDVADTGRKPKRNTVPVTRTIVKEFSTALAKSGLSIQKVAKLHFNVTGQTIRNILDKKATRTNKKTMRDLQAFITAFNGAPENMKAMTAHEHEEAHQMPEQITVSSCRTFGVNEMLEVVRNANTIIDSNLNDQTKLQVMKTLLSTVC